jgi:hypothetical protein
MRCHGPGPASIVVIVVTVEDDAVGALRRPTLSAQRAWICHLIEAAKTEPFFSSASPRRTTYSVGNATLEK